MYSMKFILLRFKLCLIQQLLLLNKKVKASRVHFDVVILNVHKFSDFTDFDFFAKVSMQLIVSIYKIAKFCMC